MPGSNALSSFVNWAGAGQTSQLLALWSVERRLPLGRRIFLSSRLHTVDDRYAD